jgi:hypothetical protein
MFQWIGKHRWELCYTLVLLVIWPPWSWILALLYVCLGWFARSVWRENNELGSVNRNAYVSVRDAIKEERCRRRRKNAKSVDS